MQLASSLARRILEPARRAVKHTPVEVLLGIVGAVLFSVAIESPFTDVKELFKWGLVTLLAWVVVFGTSALHRLQVIDTTTRWLLTGAYLLACVGIGVFLFDIEVQSELWRFMLLLAAAVVGVTLVPVAAKAGEVDRSQRFWRYNIRLVSQTAASLLWAFAMFAGLAAALGAADALFELRVDDGWYGHLFAVVVMAGGTTLVAGGLPGIASVHSPLSEHVESWTAKLGATLFIPLMLLYLAIIYVYIGKLLMTGEAPSNLLSPLALGAGALGYAGLFVLEPACRRIEWRGVARTISAFPLAFVPVVPLAAWAILERIGQYGWTEFRYVRLLAVCCLGVITVFTGLQFLRGKRVSLTMAPAILAGAMLLASFGPWSVTEVPRVSQTERLRGAAADAGILDSDGRIEIPARSDNGAGKANSIAKMITHLHSHHGEDALRPFLRPGLQGRAPQEIVRRLGLEENRSRHIQASSTAGEIPIHGQKTLLGIDVRRAWDSEKIDDWTVEIPENSDTPSFLLKRDGVRLRVNLERLVRKSSKSWKKNTDWHNLVLEGDERFFAVEDVGSGSRDDAGAFPRRGTFVVERVRLEETHGRWQVETAEGLLLIER